MSIPISTLTDAGLRIAEIFLNYSIRAKDMTEAEANAEWALVNDRARTARLRWEAGEP